MVKVSYEQKPFRREVMRTYGASVTPSPSETTAVGRKILAEHPGTTGSLGCAISEAVEAATSQEGYRYVLGSVLNQVLLHQSVIGLETKAAMDKYGIQADIVIGCAGGGSNLGGLISVSYTQLDVYKRQALHFYDAAAPLVTFESIDMDSAWFASRYDKGTADYINCPLTQEELSLIHIYRKYAKNR